MASKTNRRIIYDPISATGKSLAKRINRLGDPNIREVSPVTLPIYNQLKSYLGSDEGKIVAGKVEGYEKAVSESIVKNPIDKSHTLPWFNSLPEADKRLWASKYLVRFIREKDGSRRVREYKLEAGKEVAEELFMEVKILDGVIDIERGGIHVKAAMQSVDQEEKGITWWNWTLKDSLTRVTKDNSPYLDIFGLGQNGKTNLTYNLIGHAISQDQWIYTNLAPSKKFLQRYSGARWYMISKLSDLFIDTDMIPSIIRVHLENVRRIMEHYFSSVGSLVVFSEAKMGEEITKKAGEWNAELLQTKRHFGCGVIYEGVQEQKGYYQANFLNVKVEVKSDETDKADMLDKRLKAYSFDCYERGSDIPYTVREIPNAFESGIRPPEIGIDMATPMVFDLSIKEMIQQEGEPPRVDSLERAELQHYMRKLEEYIVKTANFARRKQNMALLQMSESRGIESEDIGSVEKMKGYIPPKVHDMEPETRRVIYGGIDDLMPD